MTESTRRAYWRKDGDDLFRGPYRIAREGSMRRVTFAGELLSFADSLPQAKDIANAHEDSGADGIEVGVTVRITDDPVLANTGAARGFTEGDGGQHVAIEWADGKLGWAKRSHLTIVTRRKRT
mgnify:CR=1 FL=1